MKKTWLIILAIFAAVIGLGYGFNLTSTTPRWFIEGREYRTVFAESIDKKAVLIAVDSSTNTNYSSERKLFVVSMDEWPGYPPKKFRIRMGMVYPLEWSDTWGHQKKY